MYILFLYKTKFQIVTITKVFNNKTKRTEVILTLAFISSNICVMSRLPFLAAQCKAVCTFLFYLSNIQIIYYLLLTAC